MVNGFQRLAIAPEFGLRLRQFALNRRKFSQCSVFTDGQLAEQLFKRLRFGDIVIIFQHGEQQGLTKPARTQKQQMVAGFLNQRNAVGAINVKIAVGNDFFKIGYAVLQFNCLFAG